MSTLRYWPYDEVRIEETPRTVSARAPWIGIEWERTAENASELDLLVQALKFQSLAPENAPTVNTYLEELETHSLCYTLPTPVAHGLDTPKLTAPLHSMSFSALVESAVSDSQMLCIEDKAPITQKHGLRLSPWSWDVEAALAFSNWEGKIHPESVFSVARRYHLLSLIENDSGNERFAEFEEMPLGTFKAAALRILRQNHYVTLQCEAALQPALAIAGNARSAVESFIHEERGHDRILAQALASMGCAPNDVPVSPVTQTLMCLLEFSARHHFLAFAMAVDFFERRIYEKVEPLALALEKRGFDEAARRLTQHKNINEHGEHHSTAKSFLNWMAPCDADYACDALRIAEAISYTMSQVVSSSVPSDS
jgi:hypothetical protein